jgi:short-subunit dehydrogenase
VRRQLIGSGVRIMSIAPGIVLNDLWAVSDASQVEEGVATGNGMRSEDVADAVTFMLDRPRHVTVRDLVLLPTNHRSDRLWSRTGLPGCLIGLVLGAQAGRVGGSGLLLL